MEDLKIPCVNAETLRTQLAENYLNNLNERLKELCQQHDEIIQKSINIMQEINDITRNLNLEDMKIATNPDIKKVIKEFENETEDVVLKVNEINSIDIGKIIQNLEKIKDSQILSDNLMKLKHTKGSLEKIETFLNEIVKEHRSNEALKHLIKSQMNEPSKSKKSQAIDSFASCSSSAASLVNEAHPTDDTKSQIFHDVTYSVTDVGYQGDIDDSEYDLLAEKNKRKVNE